MKFIPDKKKDKSVVDTNCGKSVNIDDGTFIAKIAEIAYIAGSLSQADVIDLRESGDLYETYELYELIYNRFVEDNKRHGEESYTPYVAYDEDAKNYDYITAYAADYFVTHHKYAFRPEEDGSKELSLPALVDHYGHELAISKYGVASDPDEYSLECTDCNEILATFVIPKNNKKSFVGRVSNDVTIDHEIVTEHTINPKDTTTKIMEKLRHDGCLEDVDDDILSDIEDSIMGHIGGDISCIELYANDIVDELLARGIIGSCSDTEVGGFELFVNRVLKGGV